ncbi:MAG TPA: formyltransferase family protein [Roseiarcus sp.]|nr:formyltransferase family protein [Roseiarcus sp.]
MKISVLCSDPTHPVFSALQDWATRHSGAHEIELVTGSDALSGGDILFLISCQEIIGRSTRERYVKTLVLHAGDLPERRGWSPHIWTVLDGENDITVTLLEADDGVDTGAIWKKMSISLEGHELYDEINRLLFDAELELMDFAVKNFGTVQPHPQNAKNATYCRRRRPEDSRIDPDRPLREQFNLLRVSDPSRYPAFFELNGYIYDLVIKRRG